LKLRKHSKSLGFTVIELMVAIGIVGILAVLAVFGVRKYVAHAKTAEARNSLGEMGKDQIAAFEKESMPGQTLAGGSSAALSHQLCVSPSVPVPAQMSAIFGKKYQSSGAIGVDWNADSATPGMGFSCLNFQMDQPQYYQYNFTTANVSAAGGTFVATARGNLSGDGVNFSQFELRGAIQPSMELTLAPAIQETNPEN
jgi:type IV pilus assembly protein PilA